MFERIKFLLQKVGLKKEEVGGIVSLFSSILYDKLKVKEIRVIEGRKKIIIDTILTASSDADSISITLHSMEQTHLPTVSTSIDEVNDLLADLSEELESKLRGKTLSFSLLPGWGNRLYGALKLDSLLKDVDKIRSVIIDSSDRFILTIPWEILSDDGNTIFGIKYSVGRRIPVDRSKIGLEFKGEYKLKKVRLGVLMSHITFRDIKRAKEEGEKFWELEYDNYSRRYQSLLNEELKIFMDMSNDTRLKNVLDVEIFDVKADTITHYKNGKIFAKSKLFKRNLEIFNQESTGKKYTLDDLIVDLDFREMFLENVFMDINSQVSSFLAKDFDIIHISGEGGYLKSNHETQDIAFLITQSEYYDYQLTPRKLADARKAKGQPTFFIFGNFCMSSHIEEEGKIIFDEEQLSFPEAALSVSENYIGPFFYITSRVAPIFSKKFYSILFEELTSKGVAEIGEILRKTKSVIAELQERSITDPTIRALINPHDISWTWIFLFGDPRTRIILQQ